MKVHIGRKFYDLCSDRTDCRASHDACDQKRGRIVDETYALYDQHGDQKLPDIMGDSADDADCDDRKIGFREDKRHRSET